MNGSVDLRELAIDRGGTSGQRVAPRRHVWSRYVLPLILICGFLSLVAWAGWDLVFPPREVTAIPVISTTSEIREAGTPLFNAAGWIEPRPTEIRVAALAPGVVEDLRVVEDQPVKKGEVVAELVKDDARLAHDRAVADLKLKQAELAAVESSLKAAETRFKQPVHLEADLGEAEAALAKIQTELKNLPFQQKRAVADEQATRKDYEGKLASKGVVPGVEIDIAKAKWDSALATVQELRDREASLEAEQKALTRRRDALKTQLDLLAEEVKAKESAEASLKAAEARVEQAQVAVAEAKLQLDRMTIRSPADGRIYQLVTAPGSRIGSGMTQMQGHDGSTVVTMYRPDKLQVRVDVRFENIPEVSLDQSVEIKNAAVQEPIQGKVLFISSEANIQKNTLEVKVALPDPPNVFKPEMLVDVTFLAPETPDRADEPEDEIKLYVPQQLIVESDGNSFVWVADQSEGVAKRVKIDPGRAGSGGLVEVKAGLTVSSRLITNVPDELEPGARIKVVGEDESFGHDRSALSSGESEGEND